MMNKHDYETLHPLALTDEAKQLGITHAEIRRCKKCGYENTYVCTKDGGRFLFEEGSCKKTK